MKKFIAVEGPDGCYKTTICQYLFDFFDKYEYYKKLKSGREYFIYGIKFPLPAEKENDGIINRIFDNKYDYINPFITAISFMMSFYNTLHEERFVDAINNDQQDSIIILDRYKLSTRLYQRAMCELENYNIEFFDNWFFNTINLFRLPNPDISIYISGDYDYVSTMLKKKSDKDSFEKNGELMKKVCSNEYTDIAMANEYKIFKIDSGKALEDPLYSKNVLLPQIIKYIAEKLFINEHSPAYIEFFEIYNNFIKEN